MKARPNVRKTMSPELREFYNLLQSNHPSTLAYKTIRQDYKQYTLNATQAGERIMRYAEWLEKYRGVCPMDIEMLLKSI